MKLEKEGKIFNRMFNSMNSFYVAESDIHDTMPSTSGPQTQSTVLTPLHSYDETDSYKSNELKNLQTELAALKLFALEQLFIIKQNVNLNCEHSPNAESGVDKTELVNSLFRQIDHLKREIDEKNNIISLLIKTRKSYLIQEQKVSYNTKDDVSTEKVSSN